MDEMFLYPFVVIAKITTHPSNVTILIGQSTELKCKAQGTDVVYQWMKDNVKISGINSNTLKITNIMESDEGVYKCIASNKGGRDESNSATITVYGE